MLNAPGEFSAGVYRSHRQLIAGVAVIALALLILQAASGARVAEFDAHPDEAAHFVTGRMFWEYLSTLPRENPLSWAGQYYLHYPKVGLGHWPPGYYLVEALWSVPFGSSRISAMWLQWLVGLAAVGGLFGLAKPRFPLAVTAGMLAFAIATPVFQQGLETTMSDLPCMLCGVVFVQAMLRFLLRRDATSAVLVVLAILGAAMVKGTALCLIAAPALALLASQKKPSPRLVATAAGIPVVLIAVCFSIPAVRYWAGMTQSMPWPLADLGALAGWGVLAVAILGVRREPLAIVCVSILASSAVASFFFRSMQEVRHWIIVLPALLLLAAYGFTRFKLAVAGPLLLAALLFFPWSWYRQKPGGYGEMVRQLHLPARILISSGRGSLGEGALIAEASIAERYPASLVARASKVLASSGWNGEDYKLLVHGPQEVAKRLDELAINVVILDQPQDRRQPHQPLVAAAVADTSRWEQCASVQNLVAYCRAAPPAFPRQPLALDAGRWHFEEKIPDSPK